MLYKNRYRIPSIRLLNWDYRSAGYYFVTICVRNRWTQPFGFVQNGYVCLSDIGAIVYDEWYKTSVIRPQVTLDAFVVMPDHIHGVIKIVAQPHLGALSQRNVDPTNVDHATDVIIQIIGRDRKSI